MDMSSQCENSDASPLHLIIQFLHSHIASLDAQYFLDRCVVYPAGLGPIGYCDSSSFLPDDLGICRHTLLCLQAENSNPILRHDFPTSRHRSWLPGLLMLKSMQGFSIGSHLGHLGHLYST